MDLKKLILITVLGMAIVSCELFDSNSWDRARQKAADRGVHCYEQYGNVYCEDRDGNRY